MTRVAKICRSFETRKMRSKLQSTMMRESIVRSKPLQTYDAAGNSSSPQSKKWSVRWIISTRAGLRFSRPGKAVSSKRRPYVRRWIVSLECTEWQLKFPIHRSMILWRTSAGPTADALERSCGNAIRRMRSHLPSCRRKNLIPRGTRPRHGQRK